MSNHAHSLTLESATYQRRSSEVPRRTLCGVIESLEDHCALEPDDVIVVTLCDTTLWDWTRIDFPHIPQRFIVSNVKLDHCDYLPMPFTLYYDAQEIDGNLCYGIRCDILDKDQEVKYCSEQFINVLTDKYPKTNVHITVIPVMTTGGRRTATTTTNNKTDDGEEEDED